MSIIRKINNLNREVNILKAKLCKGASLFYPTLADFPATGADNILYVDESTGGIYIWENGEYIRGGGITWVAKTANYTAVAGDGILANTSGGDFTVTLPASPTIGDTVAFSDANGTFHTNNLTIARNSSLIQGLAEDLVVDVKDSSFQLIYNGATTGWKLYSFLPFVSEHLTRAVKSVSSGFPYSLVLTDANSYLRVSSATNVKVSIPLNSSVSFPINTEIDIEQTGAGIVQAEGAVGVTVNTYEGLKTKGQYSVMTLKKVGTDEWTLIGGVI